MFRALVGCMHMSKLIKMYALNMCILKMYQLYLKAKKRGNNLDVEIRVVAAHIDDGRPPTAKVKACNISRNN